MPRNKRNDPIRLVSCSESDIDYRTQYRRDYARVVHSPAFRRMQYKTQLFPGHESDFVRNRLTHSIEVSQISKTIALRLKKKYPRLDINPEVCEVAGLLHDIGHPPFGHVGEDCLDEKMKGYGGFEANAQTLRIITNLEKKEYLDNNIRIPFGKQGFEITRVGLNLTFRTILSCIKYPVEIDEIRNDRRQTLKGVYKSEWPLVCYIYSKLLGKKPSKGFRSIESYVMDIADDIAYSTYDIDDSFKSGFLNPMKIMNADEYIFESIGKKLKLEPNACRASVQLVFNELWKPRLDELSKVDFKPYNNFQNIENIKNDDIGLVLKTLQKALSPILLISKRSDELCSDGFKRNKFTSRMINEAIEVVDIIPSADNDNNSITTEVGFTSELIRNRVNVLKEITMQYLITSPTFLAIAEREKRIVSTIFDALTDEDGIIKGHEMMPVDYRDLWQKHNGNLENKRLICDYIAGMTDRYAIEFYNRIHSTKGVSVFRPYY
jgi:dGTPase